MLKGDTEGDDAMDIDLYPVNVVLIETEPREVRVGDEGGE